VEEEQRVNTRILELAEQANLTEVIDSAYLERNDWQPFVGKFAELIIQECADIADEYDGAGSTIVSRIKKHFEVGE
jgi:hypothetical protein